MNAQLPPGFTSRPLCLADIEASVDMFNAYGQKVMGINTDSVESDLAWLSTPGHDLERDTRLIFAPDGRTAGFIEVIDLMETHVKLNSWGCVHPDFWGCGIGAYLVEWSKQRGQLSIPRAPDGARVVLQQGVDQRDLSAQKLLSTHGFYLERRYWIMKMDLENDVPVPVVPQGLVIRPMQHGVEERAVALAQREAFRDHWGYVEDPFEAYFRRWLHQLENSPRIDAGYYFVAAEGVEIAGMSLCAISTDEDPEMGWVNTLGVRRPWRKLGLGLALLRHSFRELQRIGKKRVGLGVDATSLTGATHLYEKAGMHVDRDLETFEVELRPGIDLTTHGIDS